MLQRESHHLRQRIQDLERKLSRSAERIRQLEDAGQPEALHESEERLALAMNAAQFGAFDFYPHSGKLILSTVASSHFGLSPAVELSYEVLLNGIHPDDRQRVDRLLQQAMRPESGGRYAAEYRIVGVEGQLERWLFARGQVFFDPDDNAIRFIGVTQDLTERKHLEDQFLQAQKLDGIGRLASGVAHDFNNLITVIIGYTEMALGELAPATSLRDSMEEIRKAAMRATSLTRQLLTFSRRQISQPKEVILNHLVAEFEKMLQRLIGEDVELVLALDPGAGALRADPGQIEQVILNLAINARDAMPQGGRLFIETVRQILERQGYTVLEASNGREALELAQQHRGPIHLLLTDIVMPEMGGVELVAEFGVARRQVPVVCMSGYTNRICLQGELGFLQKPFTPTALLSQLRAILDAAEAGPRFFSRLAER